MRIPNAERAIVDIRKLRDYCLNLEHPRGRHKARVFASALGLTANDAEDLQAALSLAIQTDNAELGEQDEYGQQYTVEFMMKWNSKEALIHSSWIVLRGEDFPRLTSCYVV